MIAAHSAKRVRQADMREFVATWYVARAGGTAVVVMVVSFFPVRCLSCLSVFFFLATSKRVRQADKK